MKPSTRFSTYATLALSLVVGFGQAHLHLPFSRHIHDVSHTVGRRDSSRSFPLWGGDYVFVVNATVGTPGQSVALVISPSAADTWVPDQSSSYCNFTNYGDYDYTDPSDYNVTYSTWCHWGAFDKSASSTYQHDNSAYRSWSVYSPDASYASGYNFTDTLTIGGITLDNLPMGLADSGTRWIGALGLGINQSYFSSSSSTYNNFPDRLVQAGTIRTRGYSIWLDAEDGSSGSLLMGAVDTSRYEGNLTRLYVGDIPTFDQSFGVSVVGVNVSASASGPATALTTNELPFSASIGHGETFSNLPDPIAQKIWSLAGASYNDTISLATIPCDAAAKATDGGARFSLRLAGNSGPVIEARLSDLILPQGVAAMLWASSFSPPGPAPDGLCLFAVQNGSAWGSDSSDSYINEYYTIGAALLRRSYVTFDLVNEEVAIAPVKFGTQTPSNVVPFARYGAAAPSGTLYCPPGSYSCSATSTGGPGAGFDPGSGPGSDPDAGSGPDSDTGGIHSRIGLIAGLSVGFGLLTLVGVLAAFAVWRKRLSRKRTGAEQGDSRAGLPDSSPVATEQTAALAGSGTAQPGMTETSRSQPSVLPRPHDANAEQAHSGSTQWPIQGSSAAPEVAGARSREAGGPSSAETQPVIHKGKGKGIAAPGDP